LNAIVLVAEEVEVDGASRRATTLMLRRLLEELATPDCRELAAVARGLCWSSGERVDVAAVVFPLSITQLGERGFDCENRKRERRKRNRDAKLMAFVVEGRSETKSSQSFFFFFFEVKTCKLQTLECEKDKKVKNVEVFRAWT